MRRDGAAGCRPAQTPGSSRTRAVAGAEARALINQGKPRAAIEKLDAARRLRGRADVAQLLGVAYYHADDHARAIEQLAPIVDTLAGGSIERREAVQVLGLSYFLAGRFADAIPWLEATRAWAATTRARLHPRPAYVQTHQPDRARATFARTFGVRSRFGRRASASPRR